MTRVPDVEVDAEVQALAADGERADQQDHARQREEPLRRAHEVEAAALARRARAPSARGMRDQPRAAERAEDRLREQDGREERDERADAEHEREALDARGREDEQDERDHEGDDVRVDDRREALLVALGIATGTDLPARISSLTRSKMTMFASAATPIVRIRPAMPGSVIVIGISLIEREHEQRVDAEGADRDDAEDAVEGEQEQRDEEQAGDARDQALVERLLAERRRDLARRDEVELQRQRAGLQQVREVLRGLDREAAGDLRAGARRRCRRGSAGSRCTGR